MLKGERVPLIACLTSTCVQGQGQEQEQEQEFYLIFSKHKGCYLDYFTSVNMCTMLDQFSGFYFTLQYH